MILRIWQGWFTRLFHPTSLSHPQNPQTRQMSFRKKAPAEAGDGAASSSSGSVGRSSSISLSTDASSLVDLKAEVFRKTKEAKFNRLHGKNRPSADETRPSKANQIWSKKNRGLFQRDAEALKEAEESEAKVKAALTRKAELYDKMQKGVDGEEGQGVDSELAERFLVNFGQKKRDQNKARADSDDDGGDDDDGGGDPSAYASKSQDDDWVEYVDALGRTRTCLRKDLPEFKRNDDKLKEFEAERAAEMEPAGTGAGAGAGDLPDLLSEDMRRELLRQKWEREESDNLQKRSVHYNDVLFDEARVHGAGYYRFSRDESERAAAQEALGDLHKETDEARARSEKAQRKRKEVMAARLKRVRDRKRLKMGLPMVPDDDEDDGGKTREDDDDEEDKNVEEDIMQGLKKMRKEAEEKEAERRRKAHVREWDVGKEDDHGMVGEKKVLSQQEWVREKRQQRDGEFAPPSCYDDTGPVRGRGANQGASGRYNSAPPPSPNLPDFSRPPPVAKAPQRPPSLPTNYSRHPSNERINRPPPKQPAAPPTPQAYRPNAPPVKFSLSKTYGKARQKPASSAAASAAFSSPAALMSMLSSSSSSSSRASAPPKRPDPMARLLEEREQEAAFVGPQVRPGPDSDDDDDDDGPGPHPPQPLGSVTLQDRLKMHREMASDADADDLEEEYGEYEADMQRLRAEMAPPCSMDYYGAGQSSSSSSSRAGFRSHDAMAAAFDAGMRQGVGAGGSQSLSEPRPPGADNSDSE